MNSSRGETCFKDEDLQKIAAFLPAVFAAFKIRWMAASCSSPRRVTFICLARSNGPSKNCQYICSML